MMVTTGFRCTCEFFALISPFLNEVSASFNLDNVLILSYFHLTFSLSDLIPVIFVSTWNLSGVLKKTYAHPNIRNARLGYYCA